MARVVNFNAGPAMLPPPVLEQVQAELRDYQGRGMSIMEMSHRSREYEAINYHRAFAVAETIAADKITAELKSGVLTVRLPKTEAVKPKRIAVRG